MPLLSPPIFAATLEQAEAVWATEKFNRKQIHVATNFIREWRG
jgi:hypothetical protein